MLKSKVQTNQAGPLNSLIHPGDFYYQIKHVFLLCLNHKIYIHIKCVIGVLLECLSGAQGGHWSPWTGFIDSCD